METFYRDILGPIEINSQFAVIVVCEKLEIENHGLRSGILAKTILVIVLLIVMNALFLTFFPSLFANKSAKAMLSNLFFIDGAVTVGMGALIASGYTVFRIESWQTLFASPEGHTEFLETERRKQILFGILLMVVGTVLIGLSVVIGVFPT